MGMKLQKCSICTKDAIAYRIGAYGLKTYMCVEHLPQEELPLYGSQAVLPKHSEKPVEPWQWLNYMEEPAPK